MNANAGPLQRLINERANQVRDRGDSRVSIAPNTRSIAPAGAHHHVMIAFDKGRRTAAHSSRVREQIESGAVRSSSEVVRDVDAAQGAGAAGQGFEDVGFDRDDAALIL